MCHIIKVGDEYWKTDSLIEEQVHKIIMIMGSNTDN